MPIDPEKGFHVGTAVSCILGITGQSIYNCLLLPVLPSMIKLYFPGIDVSDIGFYSGYLLSAYYLGQVFGALFWGWYSDQYGRRNAMLIISLLNIVCVAGLGLSQNYYLSVVIRLIHGLADGLLGVTKTILTEMSNEKNVSLGTSFLFIGAAIGRIVGPLMSGYLTNAEFINFVAAKIPILKKLPFLIPFAVTAIMFILVFFSYLFFSEETISKEELETARQCQEEMKREMNGILRKNPMEGYSSREQLLLQYKKYSSYGSILKDRDILLSILVYSVHTFLQMAYDGLLPNVLVNRKEVGGFEFETQSIGFIQMMACPMSFASMLICPYWQQIWPYKKQVTVMNLLITICFFIYPIESYFNNSNIVLEYGVVTGMYCFYIALRAIIFTICIVIVSNVSYKEFRGTVMGLSQTIASLGRFVGPSLLPPLYAWSCRHNSLLINHRLAFYVLGFISLLCFIPLRYVSDVCNHRRGSITETIHHTSDKCYEIQ